MLGSRSEMMDKLKSLQSAKSTLVRELAAAVTENEMLKIEIKRWKTANKKKAKPTTTKAGLPPRAKAKPKKTTKKKT